MQQVAVTRQHHVSGEWRPNQGDARERFIVNPSHAAPMGWVNESCVIVLVGA